MTRLSDLERTDADYDRLRLLGKGGCGEVWLVRDKTTNREVALKSLFQFATARDQKLFIREITVPVVLNLPGVVPLLGFRLPISQSFTPDGHLIPFSPGLIITEFLPNGSLEEMVKRRLSGRPHPEFGPTQWTKALFGIAAVMAMVHSKRVIHRDLKPSNVLLDKNFEIALADFGLAKVLNPGVEQTGAVGTPLFMSPELLNQEDYSYPADVYAYGVTVFWTFSHSQELERAKVRGQIQLIQKIIGGDRLKRPNPGTAEEIPDAIWGMIEKCWQQAPAKRLTFKAIVDGFENEHLWVPGTNAEEFLEYKRRMMPGPCPEAAPQPIKEEEGGGGIAPEMPQRAQSFMGRKGITMTDLAASGHYGAILATTRNQNERMTNSVQPGGRKPFVFKRIPPP